MAAVALQAGFKVLALKLQEAAMMHGDVRSRLADAVNDHHQAEGTYGHYIDHNGDGESGDVVYSSNGDVKQASYEIGSRGGKATANIDHENAKSVVPVTSYVPEAEDSDHYTSMDEAMRKAELYLQLPVYERFISTATRKGADAGSFAGKGKSFPILKAEDVSAALHSIGRAGAGNYSSDTLRSNIKRIAKAKGFALPDSLKDDSDSKESTSSTWNDANKGTWKPEGVELRESATFLEAPKLAEGQTTDYPIKLISPGRGSSGYYPPEVLKKAAESKVFKAGTQMFWNHDTDAEESARPEGDLNRLAAVTTTDAQWNEAGHDGPGLYARAKVFSDYADKVKEKGPHIGLSIRAGGDRDESARAPDGKPRVITALRNAASVDFVTKAGRDGKIFTESATTEGDDMDKNEVLALIKEAQAPLVAENKQLRSMLAVTQAPALIGAHLADSRLPEPIKRKIVEALSGAIPTTEAGVVDDAKLKTMVEASAKEWADLLPQLGVPNAAALGTRMTEAEVITQATALDAERDQVMEGLAEVFVGPQLLKGANDEEKRQTRKFAREAFVQGRVA